MAEMARRSEEAPNEAVYWHDQLKLAGKVEEKWRRRAQKIIDRYRDEKGRETDDGSKLNVFAANIQLLQPNVYSSSPSPDVRRRSVFEDAALNTTGRDVASLMEKALALAIDETPMFDSAMEAVRDDMLLTGRGVGWVVYEADIVKRTDIEIHQPEPLPPPMMPLLDELGAPMIDPISMAPLEVPVGEPTPQPPAYLLDGVPVEPEFEGEGEVKTPFLEQKIEERTVPEHVFWADFRMSPARCWRDVWWVARRHAMTRDHLKAEFQGAGERVPLTIAAREDGEYWSISENSERKAPPDPPSKVDRAEVWEIWDKTQRCRKWVAIGHNEVIRTDDDPLKLRDFFPCPEPLYSIRTTDQMVPLPEFSLYQDQANELDEIQARIRCLVEVLRAVVLVDGEFTEIIDIAKAHDGAAIPLNRPKLVAEDIEKSIFWWPIDRIIQVISTLSQRAEQLKQQIWELTGIHDLHRGSTKERETAKAQQLKSSFGQVRMTPRSLPMARFVRDVLRIQAEIMAELFDQATLERMGGMAVTPPMLELLREEKLRNTVVAVATDSTVRPDQQAEKENAVEFLTSVTGYLQAAVPLSMQAPMFAPLMLEMLKKTAGTFKFGKNFEDTIDQLVSQVQMQAAQQQAMMEQQQALMAQQQAAGLAAPPSNGNGAAMPPQIGMQ